MADQRTTLGEIIRRQRELTELSMRQFADMVGISNPYMSQIERGLRDPSEKVLAAIARNLDVSADALYEQAGMSAAPPGGGAGPSVGAAPAAFACLRHCRICLGAAALSRGPNETPGSHVTQGDTPSRVGEPHVTA